MSKKGPIFEKKLYLLQKSRCSDHNSVSSFSACLELLLEDGGRKHFLQFVFNCLNVVQSTSLQLWKYKKSLRAKSGHYNEYEWYLVIEIV